MNKSIENLPKGFGRGLWAFDSLCSFLSQVEWRAGWPKKPSTGHKLFWLDTFCIPSPDIEHDEPSKAQSREIRTKAINKMDLIYAGASEVLVLDSEMQLVKFGTQSRVATGEGVLHECLRELTVPRRDRVTEVLAFAIGSNW